MKFTVDNFKEIEKVLSEALMIAGQKLRGELIHPGINQDPFKKEYELESSWFGGKVESTNTVEEALLEHCGIAVTFTTDSYGLSKINSYSVSNQSKFDNTVGVEIAMWHRWCYGRMRG